MSNKYTNKRKNSKQNRINYYLIPIVIILIVIPLIARLRFYNTKLGSYAWFQEDGMASDVFLYWKSIYFILLSIGILCILVYKLYIEQRKIKFSPIYIPLGIYLTFSILSSVISKYSYFSFHGMYEQFESIWVIIGYCTIAYYSYVVINTEEDIKKILFWLTCGIVPMCLLGISQLLKHDFYKTSIGKLLYIPISIRDQLASLDFNFEPGRVFMSLYNPNYVGIYVGLVVPIILVLIFNSKNRKSIIGYSAILLALFLCLFGSQSRSGMVGIAISLTLLGVIFRKLILKHWMPILIAVIIVVIAFLSANYFSNNILFNRVTEMFHSENVKPALSNIETNDDNIKIVYNGQTLVVTFQADESINQYLFTLTDQTGNTVATTSIAGSYEITVDDQRFPFTLSPVQLGDNLSFMIKIDNTNWYFTNQTEDKSYYYINNMNRLDKIQKPTTAIFDGRENFASNRGYIWGRTLPLLKNTVIVGTGADTFALVFPNNDYLGKYNYGFLNQIATKPHNMYLQMAVQTGIVSLIAFLVFYSMYFMSSIRIYFKHKLDTLISKIGAAILASTLSYMIAGLTNDSTIAVAPIFWALIGINLAINNILNQEIRSKL